MSFLCLVATSNYTSQVTLFNIVNAESGEVSSLTQAVNRGYRFCGWASLQAPLERIYPLLTGRYVGFDSGAAVFQGIDEGICDAAIIDNVAWSVALGGDFSLPEDHPRYADHPNGPARYHCDTKLMLPTVVYSIDIALPVRADLQRLLSWQITVWKDMGRWAAARTLANERFIRPSTCTEETLETADLTLDFDTGAGVVFLSVAMTTLGLLSNGLWRYGPHERARRREWRMQREAHQHAAKELGVQREASGSRATMRTIHLGPASVSFDGPVATRT